MWNLIQELYDDVHVIESHWTQCFGQLDHEVVVVAAVTQ